jgi:hypothetical protein
MGAPSKYIVLTKLLKLQRSGQFPDDPVRIKVGQIHYIVNLSGYICNLPDVLAIAGINDTALGGLLL